MDSSMTKEVLADYAQALTFAITSPVPYPLITQAVKDSGRYGETIAPLAGEDSMDESRSFTQEQTSGLVGNCKIT